jgi:hypothetical protein
MQAHQKKLSIEDREELIFKFRCIAQEVSESEEEDVIELNGVSEEKRLDYLDRYKTLVDKLKVWLSKNKTGEINLKEYFRISDAYFDLTQSDYMRMVRFTRKKLEEKKDKIEQRKAEERLIKLKFLLSLIEKYEKPTPRTWGNIKASDLSGKEGGIGKPKATTIKEPSKEDCKIYLFVTTTGKSQTEAAKSLFPKMKSSTGQSKISRAMARERKWLEACRLPKEQALGRIREIAVDPDKIDLGKRTDGKRHGDPVTNRLKDEDDPYED